MGGARSRRAALHRHAAARRRRRARSAGGAAAAGPGGRAAAVQRQKPEPSKPFDYDKAIQPERERPENLAGAMLRVTLDRNHWLTAGLDGESPPSSPAVSQ